MSKLPSDDRDQTQRSLGFIGLSAFAHVGLLIAVLLAPSFKSVVGSSEGKMAGIELTGEQLADASPAPAQKAQSSNAPTEVLLADANDPNAVALPSAAAAKPEAAKPAEIPKPVETEKEEKPVAKVEKPAAKIAKTKAPKVESADISSALSTARTEAAKTKAAKASTPKAAPKTVVAETPVETAVPVETTAPVETSEAGDVETPTAANDESAEEASAKEEAREEASAKQEEAVPLQVALPEKEALSDKEAQELQAPKIPDNAKPIETVAAVRSNETVAKPNQATGLIVTRPAAGTATATPNRIAGLAPSNANGTSSGTTRSANAAGTASTATGAGTGASSSGGTAGVGIPFGAQVRDARTLIATDKPQATYPLQDRISRHEGTSVLVGHVTNDGRVERILLEKSSGSRLMDESAAKAFSKWKFKPGQEGYIRLPIQFQLAGNETIIPAQLNRQ